MRTQSSRREYANAETLSLTMATIVDFQTVFMGRDASTWPIRTSCFTPEESTSVARRRKPRVKFDKNLFSPRMGPTLVHVEFIV